LVGRFVEEFVNEFVVGVGSDDSRYSVSGSVNSDDNAASPSITSRDNASGSHNSSNTKLGWSGSADLLKDLRDIVNDINKKRSIGINDINKKLLPAVSQRAEADADSQAMESGNTNARPLESDFEVYKGNYFENDVVLNTNNDINDYTNKDDSTNDEDDGGRRLKPSQSASAGGPGSCTVSVGSGGDVSTNGDVSADSVL
jgi:hypothetical protein